MTNSIWRPRRRRPTTAQKWLEVQADAVAAEHERGERPTSTLFMCWWAKEDAKLQPVQIKTGISDGTVEVTSGLDEGAQVS